MSSPFTPLPYPLTSSPGDTRGMTTITPRQVYILKGEITLLITSLRRVPPAQRWSSSQQDPWRTTDLPLVKQLLALKESLNTNMKLSISKLSSDANYFLLPFLDIIRSEDTSGPVTALALSSVEKFILNDLVNERNGGTSAAEAITDAVIHAHFVSTDSASDEIVLMKILQVLHRLFMSPIGSLLSNESVCELMQSCFRMCFIERANDLLRKSAEVALHDMVRLLFGRVGEFPVGGTGGKGGSGGGGGGGRGGGEKEDGEVGGEEMEMEEEDKIKMMAGGGELAELGQVAEENKGEGELVERSDPQQQQEGQESPPDYYSTTFTSPPPQPTLPVINIEHPTPTQADGNRQPSNPTTHSSAEFKNKRGIRFTTVSDTYSEETLEENPGEETLQEDPSPFSSPSLQQLQSESLLFPPKINTPYGIPCVRELVRFLVSLINPHEKQNSESMIHLGLKLLLVAVESSDMEAISMHPPLQGIFKNELVKNLISLLSYPTTSVSNNNNNSNGSTTVILLNVLRILFFIFENMRHEMKYQLEVFLNRLLEIIGDGGGGGGQIPSSSSSVQQSRFMYEQKELALDYLVQLWKLPTFVTELYLNYDCDLFCSNLFEDITKLLSKNAFPTVHGVVGGGGGGTSANSPGINSVHLLCLDGLSSILDGIESHCTTRLSSSNVNTSGSSDESVFYHDFVDSAVMKEKALLYEGGSGSGSGSKSPEGDKKKDSELLPTHEQLMAVRHKKKLYHTGSDQFNQNSTKGITFLQSNGILADPLDSSEVAHFLRENPLLDKKMIGDYISAKKRSEILREFVKSFDFQGTRIDEALRMFLETFRLPGEAPLISHILENFAEVWTEANNNPFANVDAAYTLSYAVIMLNVDQHNSNIKQQSMTPEQFKKNLKGVNGGQEFDPEMLQQIYTAIRSEEIVMPAEHTGVVKENYMWKMLLRRGSSSKMGGGGRSYLVPRSDEGLYDHDLFSLAWGPIVAALSVIFDKTPDNSNLVIGKTVSGFRKCATISAHYGMSDVFDNLVTSLCKFTTLLSTSAAAAATPGGGGGPAGGNQQDPSSTTLTIKAQNACHTVFQLVHRHGGILREGWRNFLDCLIALFKLQCLPKMLTDAEDFTEPSGRISLVRNNTEVVTPRAETGLFSSLYSYIALSGNSDNSPSGRSNLEEEENKKKLSALIRECHPELLLSESKFLPLDSLNELVKNLIYSSPVPETGGGGNVKMMRMKQQHQQQQQDYYDEDSVVFTLEVLIKICIQNRDRVMVFWDPLREHLFSMIVAAAACDMHYLLERSTVGLLRLALRLMRKEDICGIVLQSLKILLYLRPTSIIHLSQQISFGLHEILKTTAANIHSTEDWTIIFALLEYVGAGKVPSGPLVNVMPVEATTQQQRPQQHQTTDDSALPNNFSSLKASSTLLQHSQSQDPIPSFSSSHSSVNNSNSDYNYSSASDRGYTSDSELEIRSPVQPPISSQQEHRLSGVSPAHSWILLAHSASEEASSSATPPLSSSPSKVAGGANNRLIQQQERKVYNFTPDPKALIKSCETLSFLVRDAAHITPDNFTICVAAIRSFVDACTMKVVGGGGKQGGAGGGRSVVDGNVVGTGRKVKKGRKQQGNGNNGDFHRSKSFPSSSSNAYDADYESDPEADQAAASQHVSIQLLDLLHTLHTRASQIFKWWQQENLSLSPTSADESIWSLGWKPLLQTIATLCGDSRKQIRTTAIAYLQRALLVHDLQQLSPSEWCSCFNQVLFPLMTRLLEPLNPMDPTGMEETRMRAATLLCKVFLQHLTPLMGLESFPSLWMDILGFMEKYLNCDNQRSELLTEAIPESLKNLLLVMDTAGVFHTPDGYTKLWALTWERIDTFLPNLRVEMFANSQHQSRQQQQGQGQVQMLQEGTVDQQLQSTEVNLPTSPIPIGNSTNVIETPPPPHSPDGQSSPPMYQSSPEYTSICFGEEYVEQQQYVSPAQNDVSASSPSAQ